MSGNAIETLKQQLATIEVNDEQGWLEYVPLAARLAALGEPAPLARWPKLGEPFRGQLESLLVQRSEEGIWDLRNTLGQDLGLAVIDAQDFFCFLRRERQILPERARIYMTGWIEQAEQVALDEDAAQMLRRFLRRFPLPLADRLTVVDTPLTLAELEILAAMAQPCPVVDVSWPAVASPLVAAEAVAHYDSGCPSDRLKQHFERLEVEVELPDTGRFAVSRRIDDHWRVVIDIERQDGRDPQVDLVRLGKVPGHPADDALGRWLVDLRPWQHIQRTRLMVDSPLVIGFRNGYRLRFSD